MFIMLDIRDTGLTADEFARRLLDEESVAVLPCDGFGKTGEGLLRLSLTRSDAVLDDAGNRIVQFACRLASGAVAPVGEK
jgi:arginine:pyruvate transaminase